MATIRGVILNYRLGSRTQRPRECLIKFPSVNTNGDASSLVGRKVVWRTGKSEIWGRIVGVHGRRGVVRARFRRGVPGQALGKEVEVIG